jgi:NAD(P)-dependent dehydrogenase (short-subunit alcohol dehydrogenase family)
MRTDISGRRALVTGAGSGIGRAIALRLASLGCHVMLVGRTPSSLDETLRLIDQRGLGSGKVCTCDLTQESSIKNLSDEALRDGGIDILVNNAGVMVNAPLEKTRTEDFDAILTTNVRAPFLLMRETLPQLRASGVGEVVNICSAVAYEGYPNQSAYTASKHALLGLSRSFAREVFSDGIRVHVVAPGGVLTSMVATSRPDLVGTPMIEPDDLADAVEYLLCHRTDAVCDEIRLHRSTKQPF